MLSYGENRFEMVDHSLAQNVASRNIIFKELIGGIEAAGEDAKAPTDCKVSTVHKIFVLFFLNSRMVNRKVAFIWH